MAIGVQDLKLGDVEISDLPEQLHAGGSCVDGLANFDSRGKKKGLHENLLKCYLLHLNANVFNNVNK